MKAIKVICLAGVSIIFSNCKKTTDSQAKGSQASDQCVAYADFPVLEDDSNLKAQIASLNQKAFGGDSASQGSFALEGQPSESEKVSALIAELEKSKGQQTDVSVKKEIADKLYAEMNSLRKEISSLNESLKTKRSKAESNKQNLPILKQILEEMRPIERDMTQKQKIYDDVKSRWRIAKDKLGLCQQQADGKPVEDGSTVFLENKEIRDALIAAQKELKNSETHPVNFILSDDLKRKFSDFFIRDRRLPDGGNNNELVFEEDDLTLSVYFSNSVRRTLDPSAYALGLVYIEKNTVGLDSNVVKFVKTSSKK